MSARVIQNLLTPDNCAIILIDHQPQMFFSVQSIDRQILINNAVGLAEAAKAFSVPTVLTNVTTHSSGGSILPEIQAIFPDQRPIERNAINTWNDENVVSAIKKTGRKKLVMAAFLTEICLAIPAICAREEGYEVYAVVDASGGTTAETHENAIQLMVHAGVILIPWLQVLLEFQRNWTCTEMHDAANNIVRMHAGTFGQSTIPSKTKVGGLEGCVA